MHILQATNHTRYAAGQTNIQTEHLGSSISTPSQVEGNLDTSTEWGEVFSTAISDPTLVVRSGKLSPGRSYTFSLTATDTSGNSGYAGKLPLPLKTSTKLVGVL